MKRQLLNTRSIKWQIKYKNHVKPVEKCSLPAPTVKMTARCFVGEKLPVPPHVQRIILQKSKRQEGRKLDMDIYLDNAATTSLSDAMKKHLTNTLDIWGGSGLKFE